MRIVLLCSVLALGACGGSGSAASNEGTTGGETATQPLADDTATGGGSDVSSGGSGTPSSDPTPTCAATQCEAGTHCEIVQVQCIRAPCPPRPTCVPN